MLDELLERNRRFAESRSDQLPPLPGDGLVILTCMDHRIDPVQALGLEPGSAMVLRNAGGRVTPDILRNLTILDRVARRKDAGLGDLELLLIPHTDCGAGGLAGEEDALLADHFGVSQEELGRRAPADPREGVHRDLELLAESKVIPDELSVSGLVYDTATGRLELVERRSPLRER